MLRASRLDQDGRLLTRTPVSRAGVSRYFGREIPGWPELLLEPDRVYALLRDPQELAAAAKTFDHLPIWSRHPAGRADDRVIGMTGNNSAFESPHLACDICLFDPAGLADRRQISAAYKYRVDMTPGSWGGSPFDGVMRDLIGEHVALVKRGRAGPDVSIPVEQPAFELNSVRPSRSPNLRCAANQVFQVSTRGLRT